jgi:hypothetical protein
LQEAILVRHFPVAAALDETAMTDRPCGRPAYAAV